MSNMNIVHISFLEKWIPFGMRLVINSLDINLLTAGMKNIADKTRMLIQKGS